MSSPAPEESPVSPPPPLESSPPPAASQPPSPRPPREEVSPPPPPPSEEISPPPPAEVSPPPTTTPPPPSDEISPPPPPSEDSGSSPQPPSSSGGNKSPPPPPQKNDNGGSRSPPPPSSSSKFHNSPPPPRPLGPSRDSSSNNSPKSSSGNGDGTNLVPTIAGVVVGVGVLLLLALLVFLCACRKKKKRHYDYYNDHSLAHKATGGPYFNAAPPQHHASNWHNGQQVVNLPPPPGGGHGTWSTPPSQGAIISSEMSSSYSGPHGPVLPPPRPSPSLALGFTKSSFSYEELAAATEGFSQAKLLGQGGFGYVHKGVLPNGKEIAVKSLKAGSGQGDREFQAEVEIISRVHHRHLVSLVGYCIAGDKRLLVYEFVPNSTLEFHLHGKGRPTMDWPTRLKIALGSAKGLAYLHEDCHPRIIHRDIKAANILLDYSFEALVADFGLAKLSSDNYTHVSTRVMGTFGYLSPEYASSGKLTEKSDVFSFGVMLLELITGRLPVDISGDMDDSLVEWATPLCAKALEDGNYDELIDPALKGNYNPHEVACMIACAGASVSYSAKRRPKMSQIVRALEGEVSLDEGIKPGRGFIFSSASSSDLEQSSYSTDIRKFRRTGLDGIDYASSEFGHTSEYGLNPSSSSSDEMTKSQRRGP